MLSAGREEVKIVFSSYFFREKVLSVSHLHIS